MKFMASGDWHFHPYKTHSKLIDGINSRLLDIKNAWFEMVDLAVGKGCDAITVSGDVFHVRGHIKPSVFNMVVQCFQYAVDQGLDVYLISGNHDLETYKAGDLSTALYTLASIKSEKHGSEVIFLDDSHVSKKNNITLMGIPYIHSTGDFKAVLEKVNEIQPDVLLIHQGIDEFKPAAGIPDTGLKELDLEETGGWVLAGHYHKKHRVNKVIQVGAPVQHNFGDEGQERGCWLIDTEADTAEFYKLTYPEFLTVEADGVKDLPKELEGKIVNIVSTKLKNAEKLVEKALENGAVSVQVKIIKEFSATHEKEIKMGAPEVMVADFIKANKEKYGAKAGAIIKMFREVCL